MGGSRLLCFAKWKNGYDFGVLLCFYVNTYVHSFVFLEMAGREAYSPIVPLNLPLLQRAAIKLLIQGI